MFRLSLLGAALCLLVACSRPLDATECNQLLDHYTELLVRQERRGISDEEVERLKQRARTRAAASSDFAQCAAKVSRGQWECAMKAPSVDEVERCLL